MKIKFDKQGNRIEIENKKDVEVKCRKCGIVLNANTNKVDDICMECYLEMLRKKINKKY